jgi:uncharacterized membrane protein (UPF0127 family)
MRAVSGSRNSFWLLLFANLALAACNPVLTAAGQNDESAREPLEILTSSGPHDFDVEIARTPLQRETGLMFRRAMSPQYGMLFIFDSERPIAMWMKNTYIPLDMVFVSRAGRVVGIVRNAKPMSEDVIPSVRPVYGVIELNAGVADGIALAVGDRVRHPGFKE